MAAWILGGIGGIFYGITDSTDQYLSDRQMINNQYRDKKKRGAEK